MIARSRSRAAEQHRSVPRFDPSVNSSRPSEVFLGLARRGHNGKRHRIHKQDQTDVAPDLTDASQSTLNILTPSPDYPTLAQPVVALR